MSGAEAILNGLHPSMKFTIELPVSDKIPFVMKLKTRIVEYFWYVINDCLSFCSYHVGLVETFLISSCLS